MPPELPLPAPPPVVAAHPNPVDVEGLRERVHAALDTFLAARTDELAAIGPECVPLAEAVADLVRGGKRLRAAFCYWGWRGAGGDDGPQIVRAAAAMELFQTAALIHDDVIDASDTRRGMPAMHRRFAATHRSAGWQGDAERFGLAAAVLAGDVCLAWSDELFTRSGMEPERLARGRVPYDRMRTELMAGQYLDVLTQAVAGQAPESAVERSRKVIRFKSAKYSIEEPLLIGAALAGADDGVMAGYSAFGLPLGEAFQLRDDVLGVFGDPERTGKPAGDDLREGKRTVLVELALQGADAHQSALLTAGLGDPELEESGVRALRAVIVDTGALAEVERLITDQVGRARAALARLQLHPPADEVLRVLVDAATARAA